MLDLKLYNNAVEEIISDTSKFEKLNEDLESLMTNLETRRFTTTFFM